MTTYGTAGAADSSTSSLQSSLPTYYADATDRVLFLESRPRDRILNIIFITLAGVSVVVTIICAFVFPRPPYGVNIFFAACVILVCIGHAILVFWYRKGDLDPKFRTLIYYNTLVLCCLCVCGNLYFHNVGR